MKLILMYIIVFVDIVNYILLIISSWLLNFGVKFY